MPVDPDVVAARVAGLSYGFLLFDDTGSEWSRDGERFVPHPFPNRFVYSSRQNASSAPYLTVYLGAESHTFPEAPANLAVDKDRTAKLPAGEAWISWNTPDSDPTDAVSGGTLGFVVSVLPLYQAKGGEVPRYLVPFAGKPGGKVEMHLRDLKIWPNYPMTVRVRAVDRAGNVGSWTFQTLAVSDRRPTEIPGNAKSSPASSDVARPLPKLGQAEIAIIDQLDKVQPVTGEMIPSRPESYLVHNHLWDAWRARSGFSPRGMNSSRFRF